MAKSVKTTDSKSGSSDPKSGAAAAQAEHTKDVDGGKRPPRGTKSVSM